MADTDRQKVIARAKERYGLAVAETGLPDLVLGQREHVVIGARADSKYPPITLTTKSIDDVKRWVGRPKGSQLQPLGIPVAFRPAGVSFVDASGKVTKSRAEPRAKLSRSQLVQIRQLTRAYLADDSGHLIEYKSYLNQFWKEFKIPIWLFNNVTVTTGSVLEISGGTTGVFLVNNLTIEGTGKLVTKQTVTIDARKVGSSGRSVGRRKHLRG